MNQLLSPAEHVRVLKTIFRTDIDSSLTVSLVEYVDGRLGVLRNGAAIPPGPWSTCELDECIQTFRRVCHQPGTGRNRG